MIFHSIIFPIKYLNFTLLYPEFKKKRARMLFLILINNLNKFRYSLYNYHYLF
uniref:Uncharacterized protein n=1 Tax=Myoviridae sp. ctBtT5 TaxID=2825048 RepID=A0A8S5PY52_9CAUD|nr:MAG TPA: hypothetical protein [Myoviridae sp. ctBtT5]